MEMLFAKVPKQGQKGSGKPATKEISPIAVNRKTYLAYVVFALPVRAVHFYKELRKIVA